MFIAFVNRPNGDFTFTGDTAAPATPPPTSCSACRRSSAAPPQNSPQDGHGWLYAGYVQDEFRPRPNVTVNAGLRYELSVPFVDVNDALNSFRPGQQSTRFPQAPVGLVYPGDAGVPRGTYETDKNNFAPRLGVAWDPDRRRAARSLRARLGHLLRRARRPGRLLPERRAGAAVHAAARGQRAAGGADAAQSARRHQPAAPTDFPPGLTFIGWGEDFQHAVRAALQRHLAAAGRARDFGAEIGYVGSRGKNLPIFMEVNPGLYTPGQTRGRRPALPGVRAGAPDLLGGRVVVRLAAGQPAHARRRAGINFLASYTLGHASRSRLRPEHRRRAAAGAAGHDRRRGVDRSRARVREGRRAVRRAAPLRRQLRRRAADAGRAWAPSSRHVARRLAAERHRPGADRVPADGGRHRRRASAT